MQFKVMFAAAACAALSIFFAGCKAQEAKSSGFLENSNLMSKDETAPFQRTYWNSKYDKSRYTEVYVAPVNTDYVMAQKFWEKVNLVNVTQDQLKSNIAMIAAYTRDSFIRAVNEDPGRHFKIVEKPGPNTMILEIALTQVVPSKAVLNTLGFVSWVPAVVNVGGAVATGSQDTGKGVIAFEARVRDGGTQEIIAMFADCESPKVALLDIKSLNWWAPAKEIIDTWSRQAVELAVRRPGSVIKDSPTFELLVW